jgi:hypothetical protein
MGGAGDAPQRIEVNSAIENITDTMFRNVVSTHVEFTYIADNKAYVMIYVNSLIIGGVMTLLIPQLAGKPALVIPVVILLLACLVSLVFSVISIRPQLGSGITTRDQVRKRNANLLFFGNFYRMSLDDFEWSMREMLKDESFVFLSMIKDIYYLGRALGAKYRQVRASYTVFVVGMIVGVVAMLFVLIATEGDFVF